MRFLVDENVPRQIGRFLKEQGHDAVVVRESPLAGSTDEQLWSRAVDEHRIIITHDRDFPLRSRKDVPAGLILLRPHDCRPSAIDSLFRSFWALISPAELEGQIVSVQPGRFRKRPFR